MGEGNRTIKRLAGVLTVALPLAACGDGGGDDNLTGQSRQEGGDAGFCSATAAAFDGMASIDEDDPNWATVLADDIEQMRELAPDDAPESFDEFGEIFASIVDDLDAAARDRSDTEALDAVLASYQELLEIDTDGLSTWLTERCGDELGDEWTDGGLLVAGGATQPGGGVTESDGSTSGTISLGSTPTSNSASTTTSTSTSTTTTVPVVTNDLLGDLRPTGTYLGASYRIDEVVGTNADLLSYVAGDSVAGEPPLVIATIFVETDDYTARVSRSQFQLIDPGGRPRAAAGMYDERDQLQSSIGLDTRDSAIIGVWFEVDAILSDVDGWSVVVDDGGVPTPIALDAELEAAYPNQLELGSTAEVTQPNIVGFCDPVTYRAEVTDADVRLEADNGFVFRRAAPGRRYVTGAVTMTNIEPVTNTTCDSGAAVFSYDYRLLVDGRSIASNHGVGEFSYLPPGTDRVRGFTFDIPADASELQLVGMNDEVISSWVVDLPVVAGE